MSMLSNRVYCSSSCGRIELSLKIEDIKLVISSDEQSENVLGVIQNDSTLQAELQKYSTELKQEILYEYVYTDIDTNDIDVILVFVLVCWNFRTY